MFATLARALVINFEVELQIKDSELTSIKWKFLQIVINCLEISNHLSYYFDVIYISDPFVECTTTISAWLKIQTRISP